jgi:hypothetical protein
MYLFNPDHDLALANFSPNYTPPASAARMAEELAVLPVWYAGDGVSPPLVIAEGTSNRSFLDAVKEVLPVQASLIPFSDVALYPRKKIIPWGWNPALRRKLISNGADGEALPFRRFGNWLQGLCIGSECIYQRPQTGWSD